MAIRTVLYVEDDEFMQDMVKELLDELGIKVFLASTADEAILKIDNQNFDLYILDYNLGHNSTSEIIIQKIKRKITAPPIILMSGVLDIQIVKKLKKMVDAILVKPVTPERLEETIFKFNN